MEVGDKLYGPDPLATSYIYVLYSPLDMEVRYVGKSARPATRYTGYITKVRENRRLANWIESLRGQGVYPVMEIVAVCSSDVALEVEKSFIAAANFPGKDIFNMRGTGKREPRKYKSAA